MNDKQTGDYVNEQKKKAKPEPKPCAGCGQTVPPWHLPQTGNVYCDGCLRANTVAV